MSTSNDVNHIKNTVDRIEQHKSAQANKELSSDLIDYISVDTDMLPMGKFYLPGTRIYIRAARVKEIQAYSVVDNKNPVDVTEKMNHIIVSCVKVVRPDGTVSTGIDIKDGDRLYLVFMIRELTFQKGPSLGKKDVPCTNKSCKHKFDIPLRATPSADGPRTFELTGIPDELTGNYNKRNACLTYDINGKPWNITPPTIGVQIQFYDYIKKMVQAGNEPNPAFLKIAPYTLNHRTDVSMEELDKMLDEFENEKVYDMYTFMDLDDAVSQMTFGLKGLVKNCPECGTEVHTEMTFPGGARSIFMLSNRANKPAK